MNDNHMNNDGLNDMKLFDLIEMGMSQNGDNSLNLYEDDDMETNGKKSNGSEEEDFFALPEVTRLVPVNAENIDEVSNRRQDENGDIESKRVIWPISKVYKEDMVILDNKGEKVGVWYNHKYYSKEELFGRLGKGSRVAYTARTREYCVPRLMFLGYNHRGETNLFNKAKTYKRMAFLDQELKDNGLDYERRLQLQKAYTAIMYACDKKSVKRAVKRDFPDVYSYMKKGGKARHGEWAKTGYDINNKHIWYTYKEEKTRKALNADDKDQEQIFMRRKVKKLKRGRPAKNEKQDSLVKMSLNNTEHDGLRLL